MSETTAASAGTTTLYTLLALLALDAPSNVIREDIELRTKLKSALLFYGQEMLLSLPGDRHALAALLLLINYHPTALATSRHTGM